MSHVSVDLERVVEIQPGAVVSKVIHRDETMNLTVFGFDAGEGLSQHRAGRDALIEVVSGRLRFEVEGESVELTPGTLLQMSQGAPHALTAIEPTVMLLALYGQARSETEGG
jgi:quercetin dioxygenase-like cupin family protein